MSTNESWENQRMRRALLGPHAEHFGKAFCELARRHGSENAFPGAVVNLAKLRHCDDRRRQSRINESRVRKECRMRNRDTEIDECSSYDDHRDRCCPLAKCPSPDSDSLQKECVREVRDAVLALPKSISDAVYRFRILGQSIHQIAADSNCSEETVYLRIRRGIDLLRANRRLAPLAS